MSQQSKSELREKMKALRAAAAPVDPAAMIQLFLQEFAPATRVVAGYAAMNHELDPAPLLAAAHKAGARLCLPAIGAPDAPLLFVAYEPGDRLVEGPFKTRQPAPDNPVLTPDIVLVPLLAADRSGGRLGYGGGFYDRTLELHACISVGLAYDGQLLDSVPREAHDQDLDFVLTPSRLIRCEPHAHTVSG